jgi:hypothetical protein
MTTPKQNEKYIRTITRGILDFDFFVHNIFNASFKNFISGQHVHNTCELLQFHKKTMRVSARDHFKSTSFYANIMWKILGTRDWNREMHYFSYNKPMAGYHINKVKNLIALNPYFSTLIDMKSTAENIIKYSWNGKNIITIEPQGLLSFKRGIHAPDIYVDDPFQEPENKLNPTVVTKVNRKMKSEIVDMVMQSGELHVVGTPQTSFDFFFDKDFTKRFEIRVLPAIENEISQEVLWPEWMGYNELIQRRNERGEKIFNQEYMCSPAYVEDSFFKKPQLEELINPTLLNIRKMNSDNDRWLGWDIGGKVHPSHISIFEQDKKTGKFIQRLSLWLEQMQLTKQLNIINQLMEDMEICKGMFDNTREELKTSIEQGKVNHNLIPFVFNQKSKNTIATDLDKEVNHKNIEFINDQRMINQMLVVDNNLQALQTPEGHGDSFWSIALAIHCARKSEGNRVSVMFDKEGLIF